MKGEFEGGYGCIFDSFLVDGEEVIEVWHISFRHCAELGRFEQQSGSSHVESEVVWVDEHFLYFLELG